MFFLKKKIQLKIFHDNDLKTEPDIFGSYMNHCYGITQDPITKNFMIIIKNYTLDDLKRYITNHLLNKSGNEVVDDFIRNAQINSGLKINMMEFVPYNQFKDIKFITEVEFSKIYKATWIDGNIQGWNEREINFERSGLRKVVLKKLYNSENITSKELIKVYYI